MMNHVRNNVYIAHLGPRESQPTHIVIAKMARGPQEMQDLGREAECYSNELLTLQGVTVPHYYGFYRSKKHGADIGCLLLEYCSGFIPSTEQEMIDNNRAKVMAVRKLHEAGLRHGNLHPRHFVRMEDGMRIVDFSMAVRHKCSISLGVGSNGSQGESTVPQCEELAQINKAFGPGADTGY
ncbi:hypothetical protein H0H81_012242 [Sphagnurus paluster]|uniref:Protein kinase domain-containing protein n=1 Tax=Sphagnurus paluster TaxID=117069 RepID=A0A9P7K975_9AGAR|nr:hypothetical protein H0H81_012242 [Sphagnurus paluster]